MDKKDKKIPPIDFLDKTRLTPRLRILNCTGKRTPRDARVAASTSRRQAQWSSISENAGPLEPDTSPARPSGMYKKAVGSGP